MENKQHRLVGAPRFELGTSCAQGRRATRLRYAPTVTALFILKHFPTLLLIRVVIFGLTVPKLCQILLLNRSCARFQRHLVGLAVHFLEGLSLHLQFHLRILSEDLCVALSKELCNPLVGDAACTEPRGIGGAQVKKHRQLCGSQSHCSARDLRPDESSSLKSFREKTQTIAVPPQHFDQISTAPTKNEHMP